MFTVIATFPAAPAHREAVFSALEASLSVYEGSPGALGYQILAPRGDPDTRVALMLWEDEAAFKAMLQTPASKAAHAGMSPEMWRETPGLQYFDSERAWHPASTTA